MQDEKPFQPALLLHRVAILRGVGQILKDVHVHTCPSGAQLMWGGYGGYYRSSRVGVLGASNALLLPSRAPFNSF